MCQPHPDRPFRTALIGLLLVAAGIGLGQYVEDSIDVGGAWVGSLAYNSRADVVYGESNNAQPFFVIACSSNAVVARLPVANVYDILYDSLDNKAYVAFGVESVLVVDGATHQRVKALPAPGASCLAWDPVGNRLYVSGGDHANSVTVIDCHADSVVATIPTGTCPLKMHVNTLHRKLYVQNYDEASVSIVDLITNQVVRTIRLDYEPQSGCYVASVDKHYYGTYESVSVIDGVTDSVVGRVPLPHGSYAKSTAAPPGTGLVLVGAYWNGGSELLVVDGRTDTIVRTLPTGTGPVLMLFSPSTQLGYVLGCYSNDITVLAGDLTRVVTRLPVADYPFACAISTVRDRLYVGHLGSRMVYVVQDVLAVEDERRTPAWSRLVQAVAGQGAVRWPGQAATLIDVAGRSSALLRPGVNDICGLRRGVYVAVDATGEVVGRVIKVK